MIVEPYEADEYGLPLATWFEDEFVATTEFNLKILECFDILNESFVKETGIGQFVFDKFVDDNALTWLETEQLINGMCIIKDFFDEERDRAQRQQEQQAERQHQRMLSRAKRR